MKPILKWAGGKARLAPHSCPGLRRAVRGDVLRAVPRVAAVFLHLKAIGLVRRAVLSDANDKLVAVHRAVRDDVEGL